MKEEDETFSSFFMLYSVNTVQSQIHISKAYRFRIIAAPKNAQKFG